MTDVDIAAAAVGAGVGRSTLFRWLRTGRLSYVPGKPGMVSLEEVIRVRDACRAASASNLRKTPSES